jgi:hypothetical protein
MRAPCVGPGIPCHTGTSIAQTRYWCGFARPRSPDNRICHFGAIAGRLTREIW